MCTHEHYIQTMLLVIMVHIDATLCIVRVCEIKRTRNANIIRCGRVCVFVGHIYYARHKGYWLGKINIIN